MHMSITCIHVPIELDTPRWRATCFICIHLHTYMYTYMSYNTLYAILPHYIIDVLFGHVPVHTKVVLKLVSKQLPSRDQPPAICWSQWELWEWMNQNLHQRWRNIHLPAIAMENDPFIVDWPIQMVIFHSYAKVSQRGCMSYVWLKQWQFIRGRTPTSWRKNPPTGCRQWISSRFFSQLQRSQPSPRSSVVLVYLPTFTP